MFQKRRALLTALLAGGTAVPAGGGCLDWLFHSHRQPTPVVPYAVGFAPVTPVGPAVPVGAPTLQQPNLQGTTGQVSDMTPIGQPALGPGGYTSNFGGTSAATAVQMPAYGAMASPIDNPSVLTGRPVNIGTPAGPPAAFGASPSPTATAYYGSAVAPQTSYNAAAAYQTPAPATVMGQGQTFPPPATTGTGGGFFGHCLSGLGQRLSNRYQTNYNNVPTTVYRPVQQLNPSTGQTVIVQQPCTTTTQQVQRTPYTSLQPAPQPVQQPTAAPYGGEPVCGNEPPRYQPPAQSAPQPYAPQSSYAPEGSVQPGGHAPIGSGPSQATAIGPANGAGGGYASPIPSTDAAPTAPLQGAPNGLNQPSDAAQVQQPRLESSRPRLSPPVRSSPPAAPAPAPQSENRQSENHGRTHNGATYRNYEPAAEPSDLRSYRETSEFERATISGGADSQYSDLPPIPAADDYRPPAWSPTPGGQTTPADSQRSPSQDRPRLQQPSLSPPSLEDRTAARRYQGTQQRNEQAARYASMPREPQRQEVKPAAEAPRDDSGWFAVEP